MELRNNSPGKVSAEGKLARSNAKNHRSLPPIPTRSPHFPFLFDPIRSIRAPKFLSPSSHSFVRPELLTVQLSDFKRLRREEKSPQVKFLLDFATRSTFRPIHPSYYIYIYSCIIRTILLYLASIEQRKTERG